MARGPTPLCGASARVRVPGGPVSVAPLLPELSGQEHTGAPDTSSPGKPAAVKEAAGPLSRTLWGGAFPPVTH